MLKADIAAAEKLALLADFDRVLSLNLIEGARALSQRQAQESDPEIDALVAQRAQAKKARDFALADRIRDELKARGIELIDTKEGTRWKRA